MPMKISKGVQYMLIAAFVFSLMKVCIKQVSHIPAVEVIMFRSVISLVLSGFFLYRQKVSFWGNNKKVLIMRGASGAVALVMFFSLVQQIPLAAAASMQYLSPVFAAILGVFIVKEKVSWKQYLYFAISFAGVLVIQGVDSRISGLHLAMGLGASFFAGLAYNFVRKLKTTEHPLVIILYFPLVTLPMAIVASYFVWEMPVGSDWFYLLLVGVFTQIAQYYLTRSYQLEEISKVSIINYTGLLYSIAFGFLLFGETYSWMSYIGMLLIVIGVVLNVRGRG
ncbi:EamA domain-containing membrane protein RarD [Reichenbachiella agariperforans]|uniref:EamA domain-containing membrane protein RarD n=2 Tax=Reichenbachiellaceae TaxID=2762302 RepID=A0A1M6W9G1_REIAG|nr:EamA domain-containing membrane protein RarD [Reichenbachiella agariperforans]